MPGRISRQTGFRADRYVGDPKLDEFFSRELARLYDQINKDIRRLAPEALDPVEERLTALEESTEALSARIDALNTLINELPDPTEVTINFDNLPAIKFEQTVAGNVSTPSRFRILYSPGIEAGHAIRVRVCQPGDWDLAYNATITPQQDTRIMDRIMGRQDVILETTGNRIVFEVANAVAESMVLRSGPAPLQQIIANYNHTLNFFHA